MTDENTIASGLTLLNITPPAQAFWLLPFSARGLTQTLAFDEEIGRSIRRDWNGKLRDISNPILRNYKSTITCKEVETPAFDGAWLGVEAQVDCCAELSYLTATESPHRAVVSGSSRIEGDFTFFRPSLLMMVVDIRNSLDEYAADYAWQIDLIEI